MEGAALRLVWVRAACLYIGDNTVQRAACGAGGALPYIPTVEVRYGVRAPFRHYLHILPPRTTQSQNLLPRDGARERKLQQQLVPHLKIEE